MIYDSPFPPVNAFSLDNVFDFLFTNNPKLVPDAIALIDAYTGAKVTYQQLIISSLRFGHGLSTLLPKHSTLLLFSPNSTLYPTLLFGGVAAGITVSTANSSYTPLELAHALQLSSASIILVHSDLIDTAIKACELAGVGIDKIYLLPGEKGVGEGFRSWEEINGSGNGFETVKFTEEELKGRIAYLPFSSGTTGKGKGVELSHFNITSACLQLGNVGIFSDPDIVLGVLPLYHIYGLIVLLQQTLYCGGTVVLMPKFELGKFCESVQMYKATVSYIVPPIALGLAKHPMVDQYDLSSLRFLMCGAAPLSAQLQKTLSKKLKGKTAVLQGFGMTETTSVALLPLIDRSLPGSCGLLLTSMQARLITESGQDAQEGEAGELWLRGPNVMLGYHDNVKATKETVNEEGWLMTGDVCLRDQAGFFTIVERTKELIKYSGFQVVPSQLEGLLLECEYVADAAVIGVWSEERATELPRAYVVPEMAFKDDPKLGEKIAEYIAQRVAPHSKLRGGVRLVSIIPKSPSGKILRKDLRAEAAKESQGNSKL